MRVPQPAEAKKSKRWMQAAVRDHHEALNARVRAAFNWPKAEAIEWRSPLASDGYAEYQDQCFLDRLAVPPLRVPLDSFWPQKGPCWDGLARTSSGRFLLVEAKAHIGEGLPDASSASSERSIDLINRSLSKAKIAFRASEKAAWPAPFYQYANRLAHLYFMRELNGLDAYLLFLYFADAPDTSERERTNACEWCGARRVFNAALGLAADHPYRAVVQTIIWPVPEMLASVGDATAPA